ncbi:hypothetical protein DOTSEDRAFT_34545 [Dothistroma septosporum NZE10]|uniref:Uncharacterized protein n=1 Tax=Dothistroma septosporum (strain NZE10 / CBS 128990) TaxID=675120 RepID=N1PNP0_DOTSN|nr:hypothetical protein DOTSEDRAFT_34545 [Dothistroma septosporum NZE10]
MVSQSNGGLEIKPSGVLQGRCICIPRKTAAAQPNKLPDLVTVLEGHCAKYLMYSKFTWGQDEEHCEVCGLLRTLPAGKKIEWLGHCHVHPSNGALMVGRDVEK